MGTDSAIDLTAVSKALRFNNVDTMMHALGIRPVAAHEGAALKGELLEQMRVNQPNSPQTRHAIMMLLGFYIEKVNGVLICRIGELANDLDTPLDVLMKHTGMLPAIGGETLEASTVLDQITYMERNPDYVYQAVLLFLGQHCVELTA